MRNVYEAAEIIDIGVAHGVICGDKIQVTPFESDLDLRFCPMLDDDA